jgi:uncharacterized membrane protein (Fun14 family)
MMRYDMKAIILSHWKGVIAGMIIGYAISYVI